MRRLLGAAALAAALTGVVVWAASVPAAVTTTHSGWFWGSPTPQGQNLFDVDFSGSRGYAAGVFGTLLRTDDGGASWTGLRTGSTDLLEQVRVIDADSLVAGGGNCTLLRSDDAGQTFRRLRFSGSSCASQLTAFDFASSDAGFLFRDNGAVLRTTDGGRTFAGRTPVPGAGQGLNVNDAFFVNPDTGFVVSANGHIYRTSNAGSSWDDVGAAGQVLTSITFSSAMRGYAVGGGGAVLRTDDGGATWSPKPNSFAGRFTQVRCATVDMCVASIDGAGFLAFTTDGFDSVNPVTPTGSTTGEIQAVGVSSATRVVAVGFEGATFLSDDGGASFARNGQRIPGTFRRLRATDAMVAHAAGDGGQVARTTDGGQNWGIVGVPTSNRIVDVSFPSASLGYALDSAGQVFRTDNGGGSWAITGDGAEASAIAASSDGLTVLLIGPTGVQRSTNSGDNFDPVDDSDVSSARLFSGVVKTGPGTLTLVAFGSRAIAFSKNGGASWTAVRRPSRSKIVDLDFTSSKRGYALTSDGRLWRTADRGKHWAESLAHGTEDGYAVDFGDSRNGWLLANGLGPVGGASWILHTSDGGASWRPQLVTHGSMARQGLESPAPGVGFLLNSVGFEFFSTNDGGDEGTESKISLRSKVKRITGSTRVEVTGAITPKAAGADVEVSVRSARSGEWKSVDVETNSDGKFKASFRISRTSFFVAQWGGNATLTGDGSGRLTIPRR